MKIKQLIPLIPALAVLVPLMFVHSCANTTQAPSGGPKDTIPPTLIGVKPLPGQLNVPTQLKEIVFTFNEYVTIKDQKSIFLSPPLETPLKAKLRGKSVVVNFESDLEPNTTYTIDISGAIVDNNENNPFPGYVLIFSTGDKIDSMYVTGLVQDCNTLAPIKGATVMLYKDHADSAVFKHRPSAAVKTDDWGFFCARNIPDTVYRLYAIVDNNNNNIYDPQNERIAFTDDEVTPSHKVGNDIYELYKFDMKDTAACLRRHNDYEMNLFRENPSKQQIVNKERTGERSGYITFMAPFAQIDTMWFKGIKPSKVFKQFDQNRDSVLLWINDKRKMPDTLFLNVKYMKTDTTGKLVKTLEVVKLVKPKEMRSTALKSSKKDIKHEDTIAVYKVDAKPENFEQYGIRIEFAYPLTESHFDSLRYEVINPKQKVEKGRYTLERDTSDIRAYTFRHKGKILPGYQYKLTIPHRKFRDVNGYYNDSTVTTVKLPDDDKLSTFIASITGTMGKHYIIDMMNEQRKDVIRSFQITSDCTLTFPYLKAGKICIRIVEDSNNNNMIDTGNVLEHKQPEKVRFYKLSDGNMMISIPESAEISQDIDLRKVFE